ncbi:MAG: hypothetical protein J6U54_07975 [Clostridiales bacterium]|nr:hypothetical protein [Clostridiales bacterium]
MLNTEVRISQEKPAFVLGSGRKVLMVTFDEVRFADVGRTWKHVIEATMGFGGEITTAKLIDKDDNGALIRVETKEDNKDDKTTDLVYVEFLK